MMRLASLNLGRADTVCSTSCPFLSRRIHELAFTRFKGTFRKLRVSERERAPRESELAAEEFLLLFLFTKKSVRWRATRRQPKIKTKHTRVTVKELLFKNCVTMENVEKEEFQSPLAVRQVSTLTCKKDESDESFKTPTVRRILAVDRSSLTPCESPAFEIPPSPCLKQLGFGTGTFYCLSRCYPG
jgi:hypothetical protein